MVYFDPCEEEDEEDDCVMFMVVTKEFWDSNNCFDDCYYGEELNLPDCFQSCMEACFEYSGGGGMKAGIQKLIAAGLTPLPKE